MKLLVLGNSDTSGMFTTGQTWTQMVAQGLRERGDDVELRETGFVVLGPASAEHAERKVREFEPDLVLLPVGTAMFTVGFVWKRVETLFGKRAARWYKQAEDGFDGRTRAMGSVRDRANVVARKTLRRIVGTQTMSTEPAVTDGFRAVLDTLARIEATQVALIVIAPRGAHHHRPGAKERRRRFLDAVERAARDHHFTWIETDDAYAGVSDLEMKNPDGMHQTPAGHRMLADYLLPRLPVEVEVRS